MIPLLSLENLSKLYQNHTALSEVSFSIKEGTIFGLLGPNGAGKTTLIRLINQIIKPDTGQIFFNNEPLSQKHISRIGYLPEERGLYKKMKVGEQAIYLAQLKGMSKYKAIEELKKWFTKFEIHPWWNKTIEQLSKGMAQKIQFITTIIHQPKLLILDEPFSGFDPLNTELIKSEILEYKKKGGTIIFSTHNMESVEEICNEIVLINKSKKILEGNVNKLKEEFYNGIFEIIFKGDKIAFTQHLWADFKLININSLENGIFKALLKPEKNTATIKLLIKNLPNSVELISINKKLPTMKKIFMTCINTKVI